MECSKLKILAVCQNYWPEPFNVHEMCEELAFRGHDVTVLTGLPNYPEGVIPEEYKKGRNRRQKKNGVSVIRVFTIPRGKSLKGAGLVKRVLNYGSFAIWGALRAKKLNCFDVVLAFQFSPLSMVEPAIVAAKASNSPLVMYTFDLWPEDMLTGGISKNGILFKKIKEYSARTYAKAEVIAITSPDFKTYINEYLSVKNVRFAFLPQYAEEMFESLDARIQEERNDEEFKVVFAGNVGGNQALESAVSAMSLLPKASTAVLHVYGAGSNLEACKTISAEFGISDRVIFHGRKPLEEMPSVYANADAMLLTLACSKNQSLVPLYTIPRKLQSYMAAGKPILASASGIAGTIVKEAECGFACESENPKQLAEAIQRLEGLSRDELDIMGQNARNYYRKHFSRDAFFGRLENVLLGVMK